jgi:hypothetical protein
MSDDEQRVQEAAAEFMRTVPVQDVIVSMVQTVFDVGYRRTGLIEGGDQRDLAQTALAIDTVRALMPVLERVLDASSMTTLRSALSELQLAYAQAAEAPAGEPSAAEERKAAEPDAPAGKQPQPPEGPPQARESRIASERPRIWTPGGDV